MYGFNHYTLNFSKKSITWYKEKYSNHNIKKTIRFRTLSKLITPADSNAPTKQQNSIALATSRFR